MSNIKFINQEHIPIEMHKARIVQKINLISLEERIKANNKASNNSHLLKNEDVFLDMLTDSGVNAMSDKQLAAMMEADDSYAGSSSYFKLKEKINEMFDMPYFLPIHQGRACEHLLSRVYVKEGMIVPMNYHFTTTKAHIELAKGKVIELLTEEGLKEESDCKFKGNIDINKLNELILKTENNKIAFLRIEAATNLIGGQPVSLNNMKEVSKVCRENNVKIILDASLISDNLYLIKTREKGYENKSINEIIKEISKCFDIIYFSGRKLGSSRGGGICFREEQDFLLVRNLVPVYEGFSTYGGMSVREIECMRVGIEEILDEDVISQGPIFIEEMTRLLVQNGVPMVTPSGGLGVHIDCTKFLPNIPKEQYPAASVACALYIISGIRGTERGTLSEDRDDNGEEHFAPMELLRLALPRRVFTLSQIKYAVDRITWLYNNRELIGGLKFTEEPETLRFFFRKIRAYR